jgi:hypothetical protein
MEQTEEENHYKYGEDVDNAHDPHLLHRGGGIFDTNLLIGPSCKSLHSLFSFLQLNPHPSYEKILSGSVMRGALSSSRFLETTVDTLSI